MSLITTCIVMSAGGSGFVTLPPAFAFIELKINTSLLSDRCLTFLELLDILSNMDHETNKLGTFLQTTREQKRMTLRAVEQTVGISNAYLSQLESGKIKQPSPIILHKLSELYDVSYAHLMSLVGYPLPSNIDQATMPNFAARIGPVTQAEEESLVEYLQFLRSRRRPGG